jgi:aspartyl-tRNA(Asn)/glutamyl-tRNA(Gln) amidotransferase subunit C
MSTSEDAKKPHQLTEELVAKTAKLSALTLSPDEQKKFTNELQNILGYMENLNQIDVSQVAPTSHVHGATNFFRDDIAQESLSIQEGLQNTPDRSGRFIRVPIIIEQNTEH